MNKMSAFSIKVGGDAMKSVYLRIYDIVLTVFTVIAALCLMGACLEISKSGSAQPYTPEAVAQAYASIALPIWIWAALALGRGLLHILYPTESKKSDAQAVSLWHLQRCVDLSLCPEALRLSILSLRETRKKEALKVLFLFLGCSAVFLLYALDPSHYYADRINTAVITATVFLLLCMLLPFIWALGAVKTAKQSIRIEGKLLKTAPASARITPAAGKRTGIAAARLVLLVAALGLLVYGFVAGGTADVLAKAVNICTECIGLG